MMMIMIMIMIIMMMMMMMMMIIIIIITATRGSLKCDNSYKILRSSFGTRLGTRVRDFRLVSVISRTETGICSRYLEITSSSFGYNIYFNLFEEQLIICFGLFGV